MTSGLLVTKSAVRRNLADERQRRGLERGRIHRRLQWLPGAVRCPGERIRAPRLRDPFRLRTLSLDLYR